MAGMRWTPAQEQVISLRDRNILVSAAAGSGKTAVLVERIIEEVTDEKTPIDIDRLLVVTFTRAAAGEMRSRIGAALEKRILEEPDNEHIQKQLALLHNAHITTIDSFCQDVIRNYFHVIDLDPVFRVADETEMTLMMSDVLKEVIEGRYANGSPRFLAFTDMFSPGRTDSAIEDLILHLHRIAMSYPWPEEWLEGLVCAYERQTPEEWDQGKWMKELMGYLSQITDSYLEMAKRARNICMESDGPDTYLPAIESDISQLEGLAEEAAYEGYYEKITLLNPARLSGKKTEASAEKKEQVKALREEYMKSGVQQLKKNFFFQPPDRMRQDMEKMEPVIRELADVTREFAEAFAARKRAEGLLDFNDMEHFALQILVEHTAEGDRPSETARELQEYYQEILTDEYQDSNFIQELILTSISRAPEQRPYLFMVGDVKQSIYQFRLARPELFNQKYHDYTEGSGPNQRIDLHQNFRSRAMVLESANYLFREIMQEKLGGICYDDAASLVPGAVFVETEKPTAGKTQIMLLERQTEDEDALGKAAMEAAAIGGKIRRLMQGGETVYVQDQGGVRPPQYRDIVILLRSPGSWTQDFIEVLTDMGIPAYTETKTGYFSALEVELILNMLRVIDNPRQDIPLAAVLHSCLCGLSNEEMAMVASVPRMVNYQDSIVQIVEWKRSRDACAAEDGTPDNTGESMGGLELPPSSGEWSVEEWVGLADKLSRFWDRLESYYFFAQSATVYELLRRIYQETGYYDIMSAMPAGEQRAANLDILLQQAVEFAQRGHGGIFAFVRYIESLKKSDIDFGEASLVNENMDAVRIMSIHKSKGLEFPIVFVAGLGKQFNLQDARQGTLIDADYGVGADYVDLELRYKQPTLMKKFIANRIKTNTLAEEIRILYVALTRAKELLILTGSASGLEKKTEKWRHRGGSLSFHSLTAARTYLDWIMPVVYGAGGEQYFEVETAGQEETVAEEADELGRQLLRYRQLQDWDDSRSYDQGMRKLLEERASFRYPFLSERKVPVKISVSELKRMESAMAGYELSDVYEADASLRLVPGETVQDEDAPVDASFWEDMPRPVFLAGEREASGAAKGTLYHLVMEHIPYLRIWEEDGFGGTRWDGLSNWLDEFCQKGFMTEAERGLLRPERLQRFLHTSVGRRMGEAARRGCLKREQPFMVGVPAREYYPESGSEEIILVQGIIDAWFYEGEEIVLVDYKTDAVPSGDIRELTEKYQAQLGCYAEALERLTGRKVREQIIYSFALGKESCIVRNGEQKGTV